MAIEKKVEKQSGAEATKADLLWRKPITLDLFEEDDALGTLYRGREVGERAANGEDISSIAVEKVVKPADKRSENSENLDVGNILFEDNPEKITDVAKVEPDKKTEDEKIMPTLKVTEPELKSILKIKSESFHFTDIREILRGKSLDIYAYLRLLSGDSGVCKIKHLDLMRKLDISRPTLFKQGEWLTRLLLIEKRNVPGDHLGTSYKVHRLEEVLPIPETLAKQLESHIENLRQTID